MKPRIKVIGAIAAAVVALSAYVALIESKNAETECVIPDCDDSEKEVDCRQHLTGGLVRPDGDYWVGCNVFRKSQAVGTQCIPAPCVETNKPRELK